VSRAHPFHALIALVLILAGCGEAAPSGASAAPTVAPSTPSVAALTAVAEQMFPKHPQYGYYVECINFRENGAGQPGGRQDYGACPLTDAMRARLEQTQAHVCPCEQNPSTSREIKAEPRPGGGLLTVKLYEGHVTVELVVVSVNGRLLVSDVRSPRLSPT